MGEAYDIGYPQIFSDETLLNLGWLEQIDKKVSSIKEEVILIGHSFGASMLLKYLSENRVNKITSIFLIATPFWSGDEDWKQGFKLREDFPDNLPKDIPIFLYHSKDDEEAPFGHLRLYAQNLPDATVREITEGGHQLNNDLSIITKDIKSL